MEIDKIIKILTNVEVEVVSEKEYEGTYLCKIEDIENKKELHISLPYLSMGMSEDYLEAIKQGATHIRLGRILFDKM